jgi:hypothetical protein
VRRKLLCARLVLPEMMGGSFRLGLSLGAIKTAIHRMRNRYRALLREEVAHTVATAAEVEDELRCLRAALTG